MENKKKKKQPVRVENVGPREREHNGRGKRGSEACEEPGLGLPRLLTDSLLWLAAW